MIQKSRLERAATAIFVDLFLLLIVVLLWNVNPPEETGKITPRAEAMLTVEWDASKNIDIDTWVKFPTRSVLSFRNKDVVIGILRRDDLGIDTYTSGGRKIEVEQNLEVVDFMKLVDGVYIVNIHHYAKPPVDGPTEVKLDLYIMEPFHKVISTTVNLNYQGEEQTAFSFTIYKGEVIKVDTKARVTLATPAGSAP